MPKKTALQRILKQLDQDERPTLVPKVVRFPKDVSEAVERMAERRGKSFNEIVVRAMRALAEADGEMDSAT